MADQVTSMNAPSLRRTTSGVLLPEHARQPVACVVVALAMMAYVPLFAGCEQRPVDAPQTLGVTIQDRDFDLELALTSDERHQGLSDRESIPADGGMLFAFPSQRRLSFVMRKCLVPIDIIFLDGTGRVVATHAMEVEPYDTPEYALKRYSSGYPAQFAIELRGGTLSQMDLSRGEPIDLPLKRLKQWAR